LSCYNRKVTVGLASHWPCITNNSGTTTYGFTALGREMSTPPTLQWSMAHFTLLPLPVDCKSYTLGSVRVDLRLRLAW